MYSTTAQLNNEWTSYKVNWNTSIKKRPQVACSSENFDFKSSEMAGNVFKSSKQYV